MKLPLPKKFSVFRIGQRGFVGPIGDDLPSLIPLTVALLVFFGAFGFAFNHFEGKKQDFDQRLLVLSIGKTLKGDSLIDSYEKWQSACNSIEVNRYKFRTVVFLVSAKPDAIFYNYDFFKDRQDQWKNSPSYNPNDQFTWIDNDRIFQISDSQQNPKRLICDNLGSTGNPNDPVEDIFSSKALTQKTLRVNFPVAVADGPERAIFRPAILSVMVWKQ